MIVSSAPVYNAPKAVTIQWGLDVWKGLRVEGLRFRDSMGYQLVNTRF